MSLKTKNIPWLICFVTLNYIIFAMIYELPWDLIDEFDISNMQIKFKNPIIGIALHLITLVASYYFPEHVKNILVFWKTKHPLPGSRAFSVLAPNDSRIDLEGLEIKYGPLPNNPQEENRLWFKIYKEKQNEPIILSSHGKWLLFRDMTSIALIVFIIFSTLSFSFKTNLITSYYVCFLAIQYIVLLIAARNTANRFVCNVLAR